MRTGFAQTLLLVALAGCSQSNTAACTKNSADQGTTAFDSSVPEITTKDGSIDGASDSSLDTTAATTNGRADALSDASPNDAADPRRLLPSGTWVPFPDAPSHCKTLISETPESLLPPWKDCADRPGCQTLYIPWNSQEGRSYKRNVSTIYRVDAPDLGTSKMSVSGDIFDFDVVGSAYVVNFRMNMHGRADWAMATWIEEGAPSCVRHMTSSSDSILVTFPGLPPTHADVRISSKAPHRTFERHVIPYPENRIGGEAMLLRSGNKLLFESVNYDTLEHFWYSHDLNDKQTTLLNPGYAGSNAIDTPLRTPFGILGYAGPGYTSAAMLLGDNDTFHMVFDPPKRPTVVTQVTYDQVLNQIVWTQADDTGLGIDNWTLWTATLVAPPNKVQPRRVAIIKQDPKRGNWAFPIAANAGIVPLEPDDQRHARIVRLSDGKGWAITPPKGFTLASPMWADADYVWYLGALDMGLPEDAWTLPNTFIRYSRKELGEPTLPNGLEQRR